jgi:hypothetical protein
MALEMRTNCERCLANLAQTDEAFICRYECTWCRACAGAMQLVCPNCQGELVRRPRSGPGVACSIADAAPPVVARDSADPRS